MVDIFRSVATEHRRVATEILVRRASGSWGLEEDQAAVILERLLWAQMTSDEQAIEDAWLVGLWVSRGALRALDGCDGGLKNVVIPDSAFGLASFGYRPWGKGPMAELGAVGKWLWIRGYQVVGFDSLVDQVTMVIPSHRVVQESERLVAAMVSSMKPVGVGLIGPWTGVAMKPGMIQIRASYDPVQGVATLDLVGLGVLRALLIRSDVP